MGYHLQERHRRPAETAPKTRARRSEAPIGVFVRTRAPQPAEPHRATRHAATKPASGIPLWLSRDPIGERGGLNLYGFTGNDGVNRWDYLGLEPLPEPSEAEDYPCAILIFEVRKDEEFGWVAMHVEAGVRTAKESISMVNSSYNNKLSRGGLSELEQRRHKHAKAEPKYRIWQCCCLTEEERNKILERGKELRKLNEEGQQQQQDFIDGKRKDPPEFPKPPGADKGYGDGCAFRANFVIGGACGIPDWSKVAAGEGPRKPGEIPDVRPNVPARDKLNPLDQFHGPMLLENDLAAKSKCNLVYGKETLNR